MNAPIPPRFRAVPPLVLLALGAALSAGAARAPEAPLLVWPPPPDSARIRWAGAFDHGEGARAGVFESLKRFVTGAGPRAEERLVRPTDVYAEDSAYVYVTDAAQGRILVRDRNRRALRTLAVPAGAAPARPMGIGGDGRGRIYVTDPPNRRVVVLERDGRFVRAFGGRGVLLNPVDVAVDTAAGLAWVADSHLHQVLAFDSEGRCVRALGLANGDANAKPVEHETPETPEERSLAEVHRAAAGSRDVRENRGAGPGEFLFPCGVAVAADGTLFVSDGLNGRVQVFARDGAFRREFGHLGDVPGTFARPKGISLDRDGNAYVVDAAFNNVQMFDPEGRLLLAFGAFGSGPGELWLPLGVWVDRDDRIYVADRYNGRVQEFTRLGAGARPVSGADRGAGARESR